MFDYSCPACGTADAVVELPADGTPCRGCGTPLHFPASETVAPAAPPPDAGGGSLVAVACGVLGMSGASAILLAWALLGRGAAADPAPAIDPPKTVDIKVTEPSVSLPPPPAEVALPKAATSLLRPAGDVPTLIKDLDSPDSPVRLKALKELETLGPRGKLAIPAVLRLLKDPDPVVRRVAEDTLPRLGPPAPADYDAVVAVMREDDTASRRAAARCLASPEVVLERKHIAQIVKAFDKDPDPRFRGLLIAMLEHFGADGRADVLRPLLTALGSTDSAVADQALAALRSPRLGQPKVDEVPTYALVLSEKPNARLKGYCIEAIADLAPASRDAKPDLVRALTDPEVDIRRAAAAALGRFGPEALAALPDLEKAVDDGEPVVRLAAITAVGKLGTDRSVTAALVRCLKHSDPEVAQAAAAGLFGVDRLAPDHIPGLQAGLKSDYPRVRAAAARGLGRVGRDARGAVPDLLAAAKGTGDDVRREAVTALGLIGENPEQVIPLLNDILESRPPQNEVNKAAVGALRQLGPVALPSLVIRLDRLVNQKDSPADLRKAAFEAVCDLGPKVEKIDPKNRPRGPAVTDGRHGAIKLLIYLFRFDEYREEASHVLVRFGQEAVDALTVELGERSGNQAAWAAETLGEFGAGAKSAVPILARLRRTHPNPAAREAMYAAMQKIQR